MSCRTVQVQRHGVGEGQHLGDEGVAALGIAQEVAAHHAVGEGLQGVGVEVVFLHPFLEIADHAVHVAFHGEVLVGDVELLGAHQPQFVEVGDVDDDVGFAREASAFRAGTVRAGGRLPCRVRRAGRRQSAGSCAVPQPRAGAPQNWSS